MGQFEALAPSSAERLSAYSSDTAEALWSIAEIQIQVLAYCPSGLRIGLELLSSGTFRHDIVSFLRVFAVLKKCFRPSSERVAY